MLEAHKIINGERQNTYGDPEDSFELIAQYWSTYLDDDISAKDVAMMMVLFKIARIAGSSDEDSFRDAAGYLGIANDMSEPPEVKEVNEYEVLIEEE